MIDKKTRTKLRSLSVQRLAEVWCELNRWEWPVEFMDVKPENWPNRPFANQPIVQTLGWQLMEEARRTIADKMISREWNRRDMTEEQFEAWYPEQRAENVPLMTNSARNRGCF